MYNIWFQSLDRRKLSQANGFMNSYNRSQLIGQAAYRQQRNIFNEQQVNFHYYLQAWLIGIQKASKSPKNISTLLYSDNLLYFSNVQDHLVVALTYLDGVQLMTG